MNKVSIKLPEWDEEHQRPGSEMPPCPQCKADELAMLDADRVICYLCGLDLIKVNDGWFLSSEEND